MIAALGVLRRWVAEETGTRLLDAITGDRRRSRARRARARRRARRALRAARASRPADPRPGAAARKRRPVARRSGAVREWIQAYGAERDALHAARARRHARANASMPSPRRGCGRSGCRRAAARIRRWPGAEPRRALRPARDVRSGDAAPCRSRSCQRPRRSAMRAASSRSRARGRQRGKDLTWHHQLVDDGGDHHAAREAHRTKRGGQEAAREFSRIHLTDGRSEGPALLFFLDAADCASRRACRRAGFRRRSHRAEIRWSS